MTLLHSLSDGLQKAYWRFKRWNWALFKHRSADASSLAVLHLDLHLQMLKLASRYAICTDLAHFVPLRLCCFDWHLCSIGNSTICEAGCLTCIMNMQCGLSCAWRHLVYVETCMLSLWLESIQLPVDSCLFPITIAVLCAMVNAESADDAAASITVDFAWKMM